MKSKTIIAIMILAISISFSAKTIAFGETNESTSTKKEEVKVKIEQMAERQQSVDEKKVIKEEKVSFIKSFLQRFKKTEVESLKSKTLKNFDVAIRNLENLSKRLGSRIEKMETSGKDVSEVKVLLEEANSKISVSKEEYKKLSDIIPDDFSKDSKKEIKDVVKEQTKVTKEAIKDAQASLAKTITSIKGPENKEDAEELSSTTDSLKQEE